MAENPADVLLLLRKGWDRFAADWPVLLLLGALLWAGSLISCGVLFGPLLCGLLIAVRRRPEGYDPTIEDLTSGLRFFWPALGATLLLLLLVACGLLLSACLCFVPAPVVTFFIATVFLFVWHFIVLHDMGPVSALTASWHVVWRAPILFGCTALVLFILITLAGTVTVLLGEIVLAPYCLCVIDSLYEDTVRHWDRDHP